jgi:hypothetical protein
MRDLRFFQGTLPPQRSVCRENCLSAKGASFFPAAEQGRAGSEKCPERGGIPLLQWYNQQGATP